MNKETQALNNTLNEMELIDLFGHSIQTQKNNLLKCTWNILQDTPHLESQIKPQEFKKIEIISSIFSDHNAMRLDINYKKTNKQKKTKKQTVRNTNTWR